MAESPSRSAPFESPAKGGEVIDLTEEQEAEQPSICEGPGRGEEGAPANVGAAEGRVGQAGAGLVPGPVPSLCPQGNWPPVRR